MYGLLRRLNIRLPIIQAPMAGGVVTSAMISAVTRAGGLGSLPLGYLNIDEATEVIRTTKDVTEGKFSVNVFIPSVNTIYEENYVVLQNMLNHINHYRAILKLPERKDLIPSHETSAELLIDLAVSEGVDIISFTFGTLSQEKIASLHKKNIFVIGTATSVKEGKLLEQIGCDAVIAQGYEAGGHRGGGFIDNNPGGLIGTMSLVPQMVRHLKIPVIAAGGIMTGQGIIAAQALGAEAVQMGTAFLTCKESAASALHKKTVMQSMGEDTCLTKVFTGKEVRSIDNAFIRETEKKFTPDEIPAYPNQHYLTKEMRAAANKQRVPQYASFWSGQSGQLSSSLWISDFMLLLEAEMNETINQFSQTNTNSFNKKY